VKGSSGLPEFVQPQLATLVKEPPRGDGWIHEIKFDGYRIQARLERGAVRLFSRRRNDWTASFPAVTAAVARLPAREALLDGEVAVQDASGRVSFQLLQNAFAGQTPPGLAYFAFDLLYLDGADLRERPIEERKDRLRTLLAGADSRLHYSDHHVGDGERLLASVASMGLEGIVSKKRGEPYRAGRSASWRKTKCKQQGDFVVGGFTEPKGAPGGIGALIVGHRSDAGLIFCGKVGSGFTEKVSTELRALLLGLAIERWPFVERPPAAWIGGTPHWVRPTLEISVEFTEWTNEGGLRHPVFKGLARSK